MFSLLMMWIGVFSKTAALRFAGLKPAKTVYFNALVCCQRCISVGQVCFDTRSGATINTFLTFLAASKSDKAVRVDIVFPSPMSIQRADTFFFLTKSTALT